VFSFVLSQKRTFRIPKEIYVMTENNRTEDEHD
jgi:hypothetical protein